MGKLQQERGEKGEAAVTASLAKKNLWNIKLINYGYGTPFDKVVIPPNGGYALEVKVSHNGRIPYSKISNREREGLDRFMQLVGQDNAYILGIWTTKAFKRAFLIPWCQVRNDVCSGIRGSIKMTDYNELRPVRGGWDMSVFKKNNANR